MSEQNPRVNDWVDSDGNCLYGDEYLFTLLFPANGECPGGSEFTVCYDYSICGEDFDLVVAAVQASPKRVGNPFGPLNNLVFWANENKDESLICTKARGDTSTTTKDLDDGTTLYRDRGHSAIILFDTDYITGLNPNEIEAPGAYFYGGSLEYIIDEEGNTNVLKATGSYLDICAEIKAALSGDEDGVSCGDIKKEKKCEKAGCHWDDGCVEASEAFQGLSTKVEGADAKDQPSTGYAVITVSAWAIVPMLVLLWNHLSL